MENNQLNKTFLITGVAGFIGSYLSKRLLERRISCNRD